MSGTCEAPKSQLLTIEELSARLRIDKATIRRRVNMGRLPCVKISRQTLRFDENAVMAALGAGEPQ